MAKLPLEGIRVLGNTIVWAGPWAEMLLADWGAEVIRVESIAHFPPFTRGMFARPSAAVTAMNSPELSYPNSEAGLRPWNRCSGFNSMARNKRSMTVDLAKPKGIEIFKRLVAVSDIVIDNNRFGALEEMGLGYEDLKKIKPGIIVLSITAFGRTGPYRDFRTYATALEAYLGHTILRGYPDLTPMSTPSAYHSDAVAGASGAFAIMMALHQRRRTGEGQIVELAISEAGLCQLADAVMEYTMNGVVQSSIGNRHPVYAPCGCYPSKGDDQWINITVTNDEEWAGLSAVLGLPAAPDKFATLPLRRQHHDELDKLIGERTKEYEHYELMHRLQAAGVPAGVVADEREIFADPHLNARGYFQELTHQDAGTHRYPGIMWRAENTPNAIRRPPVRLGEDNEYVYKTLLGVSDTEYARLEADGHIGTDYLPSIP